MNSRKFINSSRACYEFLSLQPEFTVILPTPHIICTPSLDFVMQVKTNIYAQCTHSATACKFRNGFVRLCFCLSPSVYLPGMYNFPLKRTGTNKLITEHISRKSTRNLKQNTLVHLNSNRMEMFHSYLHDLRQYSWTHT